MPMHSWFTKGSRGHQTFLQSRPVAFRHVYLRVPRSVHPVGCVGVRYVLCALDEEDGHTRYTVRPVALFAPSTRRGREGKLEVPYPFGCIKGPPRARDLPRWYKEAGLWLVTHPGAWAQVVADDIEAWLTEKK